MRSKATGFVQTCAILAVLTGGMPVRVCADSTDPAPIELAERAESARIAVIERVAPSVVCIFDSDERGGGSGVIISPDGYGLTNFHVVEGMLDSGTGFGGLSDGKLYPLQVLGIDPGGDVAMFKLSGKDSFSCSLLGDSDFVRVGDTAIAMGNPFLLSDDYAPTVTLGIVSGIHRYQYGSGDVLLYSDCIQVDTAINPGNSGGPLFNDAGEIIGINGRISVSMRGRVNVGMGYAITANQIKPFIPGLRAGLLVEHGTIQATVRDREDGVVFIELFEDGPAWDVGVRPGDVLLRFANQPIRSANHFASVLGTLPGNWPVALSYRDAGGVKHHRVTRTEPIKLKTRKPFEPEPTIVSTAVERVLKRFRDSVGMELESADSSTWQESHTLADGLPGAETSYLVHTAEPGITMWRGAEGNRESWMVKTVDGELMTKAIGSSPAIALDLTLRGRVFAQQALLHTEAEKAGGLFDHCGADSILDIESNGATSSTLLECITAPLGDHTTIRLGFDVAKGNLRRIVAIDNPTKETVTMTLADSAGWPVDLTVETPREKRFIQITHRNDKPVTVAPEKLVQPDRTRRTERTVAARVFEDVSHRVVKLTGARVGQSEGYGCGILVSTTGLVLTVDSGLLNSPNVRAHLFDASPYRVELVHSDRNLQLALIQLMPHDMRIDSKDQSVSRYDCFDLDDAPALNIGQNVFAGGNPFKVADKGEHISLSKGVYCGTTKLDATRGTQDFPYRKEVLVIDAITSAPGFAGGCVVDRHGRLVGMVGRGVESRFTHTQLNYAIPVSILKQYVDAGLNPDSATHGTATASGESHEVFHGIKFFELGYRTNPVYVERVRRRSPAAKAGIRKDDLIIGANGRPISKLEVLQRIIEACVPGDVLELTLLRDEKVKKIRIKLEAKG